MPFFKKKKSEDAEKKDDEKAAKEETEKKSDKEKEKVEEESESESETGSSDDEEDETEKTENKDKKESEGKTQKGGEKSEEEDSESEGEDDDKESGSSSSGEETGDESGDKSAPDETEPVSVTEDVTTAADATLDMSSAPTDLGDTMNTTTELPDESETADLFEVIDDFEGEQDGDLSISVGEQLTIINRYDDGWWEAENDNGDRGLVPSTYLKQVEVPQSPASPSGRSGKMLWGSLKKAVKSTTTTDVLHMMGSVPTGFRREYLKTKYDAYKTDGCLTPKLSQSNLYFRDLLYSPANDKVRSRPSQWCRVIQLNEFRNIPSPGQGTKVTKRCVRICLHDGEKVCSNIIQLEAQCIDKEEKIWGFSHRESDMIQSGKLGDIFVRTNQKDPNIGVLFELGVHFVRESSGTETEMMSGWCLVPLYDENGMPLPNKNIELPIHGGTPEEKGVPLDANTAQDQQASIFRSLLMRNKEARFFAKTMQPSKEQKELLDTLPDTLIGSAAHISIFARFRQILADQLLRDRMDVMSTESISDPFLATFPKAANDTFCMDVLRHSWIEAQKRLSRQQKKDPNVLKNTFIKCFMDRVYPLLGLAQEHQTKHRNELQSNQLKTPRYLDPLAILLSPEAEFRPFHTNEVSFSIVNQHCLKGK